MSRNPPNASLKRKTPGNPSHDSSSSSSDSNPEDEGLSPDTIGQAPAKTAKTSTAKPGPKPANKAKDVYSIDDSDDNDGSARVKRAGVGVREARRPPRTQGSNAGNINVPGGGMS